MKFFMCALLCIVVIALQTEAAGSAFLEDFELEQKHATEMEFTQSESVLPKHHRASKAFHKAILHDSAIVEKLQAGKTVTVPVDAKLMSTEWYHGAGYALRIDGHDRTGYPLKKHSKWMCWPVGCFHTKCGRETFANEQRAEDSYRAYKKKNCDLGKERNVKKERRAKQDAKNKKERYAKKDKKAEKATKAKELRGKKERGHKQAKEVARKLGRSKEKNRKANEKKNKAGERRAKAAGHSNEKKQKNSCKSKGGGKPCAPSAPLNDFEWHKLCEVATKKLHRLRGKCRGYKRFCKLYKDYGMDKEADRHCALMLAAHKKLLANRLKKRLVQRVNRRYVRRIIKRRLLRRL